MSSSLSAWLKILKRGTVQIVRTKISLILNHGKMSNKIPHKARKEELTTPNLLFNLKKLRNIKILWRAFGSLQLRPSNQTIILISRLDSDTHQVEMKIPEFHITINFRQIVDYSIRNQDESQPKKERHLLASETNEHKQHRNNTKVKLELFELR